MHLQRTLGNGTLHRVLRHQGDQPKLAVTCPDDPSEREADRLADHVMRLPPSAGSAGPSAAGGSGAGRSLDGRTRGFFEARFGHDFGQVRLHVDARAAESARALQAKAYTVGRDIVFGAGAYAPGTGEGQRLLAHELAHTIQQGASAPLQRSAAAGDAAPLPLREPLRAPVVARTLDPDMCAEADECDAPDGTDGPTGRFLLTIYADKEGPFLLLPATHKVGHSWLKLTHSDGRYWTYGFWPQVGYDASDTKADVEGCVHHPDGPGGPAGARHTSTAEQTFELTEAEFEAARALAASICRDRPAYNLFGLQCTEFVRRVLEASGHGPGLGFGLIWESPNALDSWIRSNALVLGIGVTAATSAEEGEGAGAVGLDLRYTHQFASVLGDKLRFHWMARGELSGRMASVATGPSIELTSQRVYLPSLYVFGGGILGELTPSAFEEPGQRFGAGLTAGAGLLYRIDELGMIGVEYNLVKDFVANDPALNRLMVSAGIRLW